MGGDDRPNSAVSITLKELYDKLVDTRERMVVMANDIRWVKDVSDGFVDRVCDLQDEHNQIWAEINSLRTQIGEMKASNSGLWATIQTAASILGFVISILVMIYVAVISAR